MTERDEIQALRELVQTLTRERDEALSRCDRLRSALEKQIGTSSDGQGVFCNYCNGLTIMSGFKETASSRVLHTVLCPLYERKR